MEKMNLGVKPKPARPKEKAHHVQVFVRVRPLNTSEKNRGFPVVQCCPTEVIVKDRQEHKVLKTFSFDRVFDQNSTQAEVYTHVLKHAIEDILKGYNYTVFAYGQSGSGKTYTLSGDRSTDQDISWEDDPLCGLVPRALAHLFDELRLLQAEFTIRVSYLELCYEEISDLLSRPGDTSKLRLYEDGSRKGAVCVHGLEEEVLHTRRDLHNVLQKCIDVNTHSRSHTVFTATVHIKENSMEGDELVRTAKLCLVDLAASESGSRSGGADKGPREQASANHSLLTLGRVITALVERGPHVPYRESKLTRLLRDALSGRSRASIIGTISPASVSMEETLATLEYVHRARSIAIRPELNPKLTKESLIKEYMDEIERLKRDLEACRNKQGVYLLNEDYTRMVSDTARLNKEISEKLAAIRVLDDQIHRMRILCRELGMQLDVNDVELAHARGQLRAQLWRRDETQHLLERHLHTRESLSDQAGVLLRTVDETFAHMCALHNKLDRSRRNAGENHLKRQEMGSEFCRDMQAATQDVRKLVETFSESIVILRQKVGSAVEGDMPLVSSISHNLSRLAVTHEEKIKSVEAIVNKMVTDATALVDEAVSNCTNTSALDALMQDYTENFLSALLDVCARLQSCTSQVVDMFRKFESKIFEETAWMSNSRKKQRESILIMREEFLKGVERRQMDKQRMWKLIHNLKECQNRSNTELLAKMAEMRVALGVSQVQGAEYQKILSSGSEECRRDNEDAAITRQRIADDLNHQKATDSQLLVEMKCRSEQFLSDLKEALDQAKAATTQVKDGLAKAKGEVTSLAVAGATTWTRRRERAQEDVRMLRERLDSRLYEQECAAGHVCTATWEDACSCASLAVQLQCQSCAVVDGVLERLESHGEHVSSWLCRMDSSVQRANEHVSLIAEDHVTDEPTGNTPERKEYEYPRKLVATSPHDKILSEFRASRKNLETNLDLLNSTTEEEEEMLAQEDDEMCSLPTSSSVDDRETSPCSEVSSMKAVSGSERDLSAMVSDKENVGATKVQSASKLPVMVTHSARKLNVCKQILSPRN